MKATIDLDPALYRRLKVEAARRGRTIRDLVNEAVLRMLGPDVSRAPATDAAADDMPWFGALREFAANARGRHSISAVRSSITRGRRRLPR